MAEQETTCNCQLVVVVVVVVVVDDDADDADDADDDDDDDDDDHGEASAWIKNGERYTVTQDYLAGGARNDGGNKWRLLVEHEWIELEWNWKWPGIKRMKEGK